MAMDRREFRTSRRGQASSLPPPAPASRTGGLKTETCQGKVLAEMAPEEGRQFGKGRPGLGHGWIIEVEHVAHAFEDHKFSRHARSPEPEVHAAGVRQEEVARAGQQQSRRKAGDVAVDGRQQGIAEGRPLA